ncbi:signal peptidase II [Plantibacter sp. 2H11-2]|uniref:signal peptidase II n=1 Tax=Plantibacter sp. 2H11-2 TaxID=3414431 RepID=UPI003CEA3E1A
MNSSSRLEQSQHDEESAQQDTSPARRRRLRLALLSAVIMVSALLLDQLTKEWAIRELAERSIPMLPTTSLGLVYNPGVAFGIGSELGPALSIGLFAVVLAMIGLLAVCVARGRRLGLILPLALVIGGAAGNVFDRVFRITASGGPFSGHVVDFLAIEWFAVFNLADVFTVGGVLLGVALYLAHERADERAFNDATASSAKPPQPTE